MSTKLTLEEALRQCLQDDNKISKYEAQVIHGLVLADGKISVHEKELLRKALDSDELDEQAIRILSDLVMRADLKMK